jgi:hypothetical protein
MRYRYRRAVQNGFGNDARCVARECWETCGHFIQNRTEGEEIGAGVHFLAAHLLGRHKCYSANGCAGSGKQVFRRQSG